MAEALQSRSAVMEVTNYVEETDTEFHPSHPSE